MASASSTDAERHKQWMRMAEHAGRLGTLHIHFEEAEDGWITARVEEEPAAISQGRSEDEALANVLDAVRDVRGLTY